MKIIPKDTKPKNYIWKKYSIKEVILATILLGVSVLILTKGGTKNLIFATAFALVSTTLFIPIGKRFLYQEIFLFFKFLFSKKKFIEKDIDKLMPFKDITEDGYIVYENYFGKVLEIGSKNFGLLDKFSQDIDIEMFANSLNVLDAGDVIDIIRIDKTLILDDYKTEILSKINREIDPVKKAFLFAKLSDIELLNTKEAPIYMPSYYIVFYGPTKTSIDILISAFNNNFICTEINTKKLNRIDTAIFLKNNFSREFNEREAKQHDEAGTLIEWIKPKEIMFGFSYCKIDDLYTQIFSIDDYMLEVGNGWASSVFNETNTRTVIHIEGCDKQMSIKRVDKALNEILSRRKDIYKASESISNDIQVESIEELLLSLQNGNEKFFDVTTIVTGFNYSRSKTKLFRKLLKSKLANSAFVCEPLVLQQAEGFISGNLSKHNALKACSRGINSISLAACFPFTFQQTIDKKGDYLGYGANGSPVFIDIWKRGADYKNSNAFVVGTSGSGKSYFLKSLLSHVYAQGNKVFILDPENEYKYMAHNLGGKLIDIGRGDKGRINPFHIYPSIPDDDSDSEEKMISSNKATFGTHLRSLESFFKIILRDTSSEILNILNNAIIQIYSKRGIGPESNFNILKPEDFPIFDDLSLELKQQLKEEKNDLYQRRLLSLCVNSISKFTGDGVYGDLWNGPSTLKSDHDFTVINFQSLFASKNETVANAQMLLVFRFLEQQLINQKNKNDRTGQQSRTMIVVDEAHMFIDIKYLVALDFFYQMAKRIRKYSGSFIPATQSISDWTQTKELKNKTSAILKNSQYSFIFKLKGDDIEDLSSLYKSSMPINQDEKFRIARANTGECFFIGSENMRSVFQVDANDTFKNFFETKLKEKDIQSIKDFVSNVGRKREKGGHKVLENG